MKDNKACGPDDHPVEFWQAILKNGNGTSREGAQFLVGFCNAIWHQSSVPTSWHLQRVALIYKKGDPADCSNYRPIFLLNAAYKIFAMVILQRLLRAGADEHIGSTQFGFRKKRGTEDALHCVRRAVERAWAERYGCLHMLAVDWSRAFDSISTEALINSVIRLGVFQLMSSALSNRFTLIVLLC